MSRAHRDLALYQEGNKSWYLQTLFCFVFHLEVTLCSKEYVGTKICTLRNRVRILVLPETLDVQLLSVYVHVSPSLLVPDFRYRSGRVVLGVETLTVTWFYSGDSHEITCLSVRSPTILHNTGPLLRPLSYHFNTNVN